jgi:hypothetical protein
VVFPFRATVCQLLIQRENREFSTDLNNASEFPMHGAVTSYCATVPTAPQQIFNALSSQPHCTQCSMQSPGRALRLAAVARCNEKYAPDGYGVEVPSGVILALLLLLAELAETFDLLIMAFVSGGLPL